MGKSWVRLGWVVFLVAACDGGGAALDGGTDGGSDASVADAGDAGAAAGKPRIGSACTSDKQCGSKLFCDRVIDVSFGADNLPRGVDEVPSELFPGGSCTPVPSAPAGSGTAGADTCDPTLPQASQGCGSDGVCDVLSVDSQTTLLACRRRCDPASAQNECGRFGYACDFELGACVEGCQSDEECRLRLLDSNGDGAADALAYDDTSKAVCDPESFRCVHHGSASSMTGDACERLDDCAQDGFCLDPLQPFVGMSFPGGACTKLGCDLPGRECDGDGTVCTRLRSWSPGVVAPEACFPTCQLGAEPEADQLGVDGHGQGCRPGYRCHYNGGLRTGEGVCVGGNYNAVTDNNVGAACQNDADCYSPFGLGRCLALSVGDVSSASATCTVMDCALPQLPDDLCGKQAVCVGLNGDTTFCVQRCSDASECADGFACTDDDGDPGTGKVCYPACLTDADCRKGKERCSIASGSSVGRCVAL